jgi:ComEC/Rec2-related protein
MKTAFFAYLAGILLSVNLINIFGLYPVLMIYSAPAVIHSIIRLAPSFDKKNFFLSALLLFAGIGGILSGWLADGIHTDSEKPDPVTAPVTIEAVFTITGFPDVREIAPNGKLVFSVRAGGYQIISEDAGKLYPSMSVTVHGTLYPYGGGGSIYASTNGIAVQETGIAPLSLIAALRNNTSMHFVRTKNPVTRALLFSLITGNRAFMSYSDLQSFRMSGIVHLLALSGLHVGLISFGIVFLLRRVMREKTAYLISSFAVMGYMALGGMGPSLLRAGLMFVLYTFLRGIGRKPDFIDILIFSAFVLLMIDPLLVRNIGFVLSYVSTAAIVLFSGPVRSRLGLKGYYGNIFAGTLAANTATLPFLFYYFQGASLIAPLTNLLVIPVFGVILGLVFLHFLLSLFGIFFVEAAVDALWSGIGGFSDILTRPGFVYIHIDGFNWLCLIVSLLLIAGIFFVYPRIRYRSAAFRDKSA